jgi:hypothetical protein
MLPISLPGYPEIIDSRVLAAANEPEFSSEFPFQRDMNIGNPVRCVTVALSGSFVDLFSFREIDRRWMDSGQHRQWYT